MVFPYTGRRSTYQKEGQARPVKNSIGLTSRHRAWRSLQTPSCIVTFISSRFFFVADAAGGDGYGHAGFLGVLADEVFADGGAADVAGADSHDSVHGSSVSVGWRVVGRGG